MDLALPLLIFATSLPLLAPTLKRRIQMILEKQSLRLSWRTLVADPRDAREHEGIWGVAPEGVKVLGTWMTNLETDSRGALDWRKVEIDLQRAVEWKHYGFSSSEARQWKGFKPHEARRWRDLAFTTETAACWRSIGLVNPVEAHLWRADGLLSPADANPWLANRFDPVEAVNWIIVGVRDPVEAQPWADVGVGPDLYPEWSFSTPGIAREWIEQGVESQMARRWIESGCDFDVAEEWIRVGVDAVDVGNWSIWAGPSVAGSWIEQGFLRADDARRWHEVGIEPELAGLWSQKSALEPSKAAGWIDAGILDPSQVQGWIEVGFVEYAECKPWVDFGFSAENASQWSRQRFDAESASSWGARGFRVADAALWRAHRINAEDALSWRRFDAVETSILALLAQDGCRPDELNRWLKEGVDASDVLVERRFWSPEVRRNWLENLESLGLSEDDVPLIREISQEVQVDAVAGLIGVVGSIADLAKWVRESFGPTEIADWRKNFVEPVVAASWREGNFDPESARSWHRVGCSVTTAKELAALDARPEDWPSLEVISREENVDFAEAIWRDSISRAGLQRIAGTPVFAPPRGNAEQQEFEQLLVDAEASGCSSLEVVHGCPLLSQEMLRVVPEARLQRGSVKRLLWEYAEQGRVSIADSELNTSTHSVRLNRGGPVRLARFSSRAR